MTDRLREIVAEFQGVPDEFRVEMLLERARQFPPLPERYQALREKGLGRVHECMAEVYFFPEVADHRVHIHADIPRTTQGTGHHPVGVRKIKPE